MFNLLIDNGSVAIFGMVLLHTLWQGAVICIGATLLLATQRHARASMRYATYCGALGLLVVTSIVTYGWQTSTAPPSSGVSLYYGSERDFPEGPETGPEMKNSLSQQGTDKPISLSVNAPGGSSGTPFVLVMDRFLERSAPWLGMTWLVVVPLLLVRLIANYMRLRLRHLQGATPAPANLQLMVEQLGKRLRYSRPVQLMISARVAVPMVVGWLKPVILLPTAFVAGVPSEQIEALLVHELAHLRRFDPVVNILQCIAEIILFFNPAAWWLSRCIRIEREYCCDDLTLEMGTNPTLYAESLLALAENAIQTPVQVMSSNGGVLLERIKRILGMGVEMKTQISMKSGLLSAAMIVGMMLFVSSSYVFAGEKVYGVPGAYGTAPQANPVESQQPVDVKNELGPKQTEANKLQFPTNRSIGEVYIRKAGINYATSNWEKGHGIGWLLLSQAQGTVTIPEGMEVYFVLKEKNLEHLNNLLPDSLARLECNDLDVTEQNIAPIASLTGLKSLILGGNRDLTDAAMEKLAPLQNIEWFHIIRTGVQKLTFIKHFKKLQKLEINDTNVDEEGMANLAAANLPNLASLYIEGTQFAEQGFESISRINSLKGLWIDKMNLDDTSFRHIASSTSIEYIKAKASNFNDTDLDTLKSMRSLKVLHIPMTQVTDEGMAHVAKMPALEQLYLYGNENITENCLPTLAMSRTLWEVEASNTGIPYESLKAWRNQNNYKRKSFPTPSAPQRSTNAKALKVGIGLSDFQATGPHWMPDPYGYEMNGKRGQLIQLLKEANVDLYAVIEPNTAKLGELPQVLASTGLSTKTVDSTNPAALNKLDVVCLWRSADILEDTLAALQKSVSQGLGLVLNANVGSASPELNNPLVMDLVGHSSQDYLWWGNGKQSFEIVNGHPILGDLKPGTKIEIKSYNGAYDPAGPPQGTLLIGPSSDCNYPFYPMYLRDYGKGHIVNNVFWDLEVPGILPETFYMRCVNWAAGRPVGTKY